MVANVKRYSYSVLFEKYINGSGNILEDTNHSTGKILPKNITIDDIHKKTIRKG